MRRYESCPTKEEAPDPRFLASIPICDLKSRTLVYGLYPQSRVKDETLTSKLDGLAPSWNGWVLFQGWYYCKGKAFASAKNSCFDDGDDIVNGQSYWFLCEPIKWKVFLVSEGLYKAVSFFVLDGCRYDEVSNDYELSFIRKWLNESFFKTAFAAGGAFLKPIPAKEGGPKDKVGLLSLEECKAMEASFRASKASDYAKANYVEIDPTTNEGSYWTNSPYASDPDVAYYVGNDGSIYFSSTGFSDTGVRPCIYVKLSVSEAERIGKNDRG